MNGKASAVTAEVAKKCAVAAQTLQSRRLISYRRGRIQIVKHKGLKAAACECYEVVSQTFDHFWSTIFNRSPNGAVNEI